MALSSANGPVGFPNVSLADIRSFLAVQRYNSVTMAAQELGVSQGQVSKALARLERELNMKLFARGGGRLTLTDEGRRATPFLAEAIGSLQRLRGQGRATRQPELSLAGPPFLLGLILSAVTRQLSRYRLRLMELQPPLVRMFLGDGAFDITFTPGETRLPPTWKAVQVGTSVYALFGAPEVVAALGDGTGQPLAPQALQSQPIIGSVYYANRQFLPSTDGFALSAEDRTRGHEVGSLAMALDLARHTDQLVFAPITAAAAYVKRGELLEVPLSTPSYEEPIYVACNIDRVPALVQNAVVEAARLELEQGNREARVILAAHATSAARRVKHQR